MARSRLDAQLQEIDDRVTYLGRLVDQGLESALAACTKNDREFCERIIAGDEQIDTLQNDISRRIMRLLILQQPLGARDLRFLTAALSIVNNLERLGDGAAGIARLQLQIIPLYNPEASRERETQLSSVHVRPSPQLVVNEATIGESLQQLGEKARELLQKTMQAFVNRDPLFARTLIQEDEFLNVRYRIIRYDLMSLLQGLQAITSLQKDTGCLQRVTYLLWIAHKLERAGDHCTNICERIIYIVEGSPRVEHSYSA